MAEQDVITINEQQDQFMTSLMQTNAAMQALNSLLSLICEEDLHYELIKQTVEVSVKNHRDLQALCLKHVHQLCH